MTMPTNEKKGVTVKIDADLHAEVKRYIEAHEMTMGDFVAFTFSNFGLASAMAVAIMAIIILIYVVQNKIIHKFILKGD